LLATDFQKPSLTSQTNLLLEPGKEDRACLISVLGAKLQSANPSTEEGFQEGPLFGEGKIGTLSLND
jgi:hypothetical protein